jgi:tetratricopeptide (TPR) repeat protein
MAQKANPKEIIGRGRSAHHPVAAELRSWTACSAGAQVRKGKTTVREGAGRPHASELTDRAAVHLSTCNQHLERSTTQQFKSVEEHYDYAVSLMNVGDYVTAREHIEKLLKQSPKTDFVIYGLAALDCLTGHVEDSLKHLDEALRLNAGLRFQARNDSDFHNLAEDPRFTELLYPDPAADLRLRRKATSGKKNLLRWILVRRVLFRSTQITTTLGWKPKPLICCRWRGPHASVDLRV